MTARRTKKYTTFRELPRGGVREVILKQDTNLNLPKDHFDTFQSTCSCARILFIVWPPDGVWMMTSETGVLGRGVGQFVSRRHSLAPFIRQLFRTLAWEKGRDVVVNYLFTRSFQAAAGTPGSKLVS